MPLTAQEQAELQALEAEERQGSGIQDTGKAAKFMDLAEKSSEPEPLVTRGGQIGGAVGTAMGAPFGPGGRMAGSAIGGALGDNLSRQYEATRQPYTSFLKAAVPEPGKSAVQGGIQGGTAGLLELLGAAATRFGFPRAGATLQATTPAKSTLRAAPEAVQSISTPTAGRLSGASETPGALMELGRNATASAGEDLATATAAQKAKGAAAKIQPQLAAGAERLAPLNKTFAGEVEKAMSGGGAMGAMNPAEIEEAVRQGQMTSAEAAQRLLSMNFGKSPAGSDMITQAFRRPNAFPATAGSSEVASARIPLAAEASHQGMLGKALGQANEPIAAATARGVDTADPNKLAGEAAGLKAIFGKPEGSARPIPEALARMVGGRPAQMAVRAASPAFGDGMSESRAGQTLAALLAERWQPQASMSGGTATRVGGALIQPGIEETLRQMLYGDEKR